jgi:excisionase family DNA binding protein
MPEYVKPGEAATMLGVSRDTIRRYVDLGLLEGIKTPGGQRRIERDSVQDVIDRRVVVSSTVRVVK